VLETPEVLSSYLIWQVLNPLRKAMRGAGGVEASRLLLATDPDREGEAIAWHVLELLQAHGSLPATCAVQRISFSEITKKAVDDALAAPRDIDMPLVRAQQARTETQTDPRP
jgi:DNA topoisomerase I